MANKKKSKTSYILPSKKTTRSRKGKATKKTVAKRNLSGIQKLIIGVIVAAIVVVAFALICVFVLTPERTIKTEIEKLAADYYESSFYGDGEETLSKYKDSGLAPVTLRQLILHDVEKNHEIGERIKKYCDENSTMIIFYPEEQYSKTSFRAEYTYSCEF